MSRPAAKGLELYKESMAASDALSGYYATIEQIEEVRWRVGVCMGRDDCGACMQGFASCTCMLLAVNHANPQVRCHNTQHLASAGAVE